MISMAELSAAGLCKQWVAKMIKPRLKKYALIGTCLGQRRQPCLVCGDRRQCRSFTLLELLITLVVMLLLTAVLFSGVNMITRSWVRLQAVQEHFSQVMTLDRTIDTIFSNTLGLTWPDADGNELPMFVGEAQSLSLAYLHRLNNSDDGAVRCVRLRVNTAAELVADYSQRPVLDWQRDPSEPRRQSVLATGVERITFVYADWEPDRALQWHNQWDPERLEVPLAIHLTVFWQNGQQETWLRRTAGNSYRLRYGNWQPEKP